MSYHEYHEQFSRAKCTICSELGPPAKGGRIVANNAARAAGWWEGTQFNTFNTSDDDIHVCPDCRKRIAPKAS